MTVAMMCGRDPSFCQGGTSTDGWWAIGAFFVLMVVVLAVVGWRVFRS